MTTTIRVYTNSGFRNVEVDEDKPIFFIVDERTVDIWNEFHGQDEERAVVRAELEWNDHKTANERKACLSFSVAKMTVADFVEADECFDWEHATIVKSFK